MTLALACPAEYRSQTGSPSQRATKEYAGNLESLVKKLQAAGATLIWASTTPIPEGARGRVAGEEIEFNKIADKIMKAMT